MAQVSVVIPVFNGERFIAEAIRSVQEQTVRPLEVIVVDDGSRDSTEKVVRQCSGPVPVVYHYQENQGPGIARNRGVAHARGEWIAFLDADDVWYPDKLSVQMEHIRTYPKVDFFYSDFDVAQPDGTVARRAVVSQFARPKKAHWKKLSHIVFNGQPFPFPSTVLLRKSVFTRLTGFRSYMRQYFEDFELFARIAKDFSFHFIAQPLVRYRLKPKSQREFHSTPNVLFLLDSLWRLWWDQPDRQAILIKHYAHHYALLGKYSLQDGRFLEAREFYRLSFGYYPGLYYPWCWKNLRRWALCYLPGLRRLYSRKAMKRINAARRSAGIAAGHSSHQAER